LKIVHGCPLHNYYTIIRKDLKKKKKKYDKYVTNVSKTLFVFFPYIMFTEHSLHAIILVHIIYASIWFEKRDHNVLIVIR